MVHMLLYRRHIWLHFSQITDPSDRRRILSLTLACIVESGFLGLDGELAMSILLAVLYPYELQKMKFSPIDRLIVML